jgi:hypothetical protein
VRAIIGELLEAEARQERGEPAHLAEMIVRLMRISIARNTALEERSSAERAASVLEMDALRRDMVEIARRHALPGRRRRAVAEVEARFTAASFPFRHNRALPTTIVRADAGDHSLDPTFKTGLSWPEETKRAIIERGYRLTGEVLEPPA